VYPVPGKPLVPLPLQPVLAEEPIPGEVLKRYGLPPDSRVAQLDEMLDGRLSPEQLEELASVVKEAAQQRRFDLMALDAPLFEDRPIIDALDLIPRTRNNLIRGGLVDGGRLRPTTIGTAARIKGFGVGALLDVLTAVTAGGPGRPAPPAKAASTGEDRRSSKAVIAVAVQLERKRWADAITNDDPRLARAMTELHPTAGTPREAAELLAEGSYTPGEAKRTVNAIRRFIADADALRRLPVDQELEQILIALTPLENARTAMLARTGLGGEPPVTLDVAAGLIGVTRERVRQMERKLHERIGLRSGIWTPALDRTLLRVSELLPTSAAELEKQLAAEGLTARPVSVPSLLAAAQLFGRELAFSYHREFGTLSRAGEWAPASSIAGSARRLVEHWGATTTTDVEAAVEEAGGDVDPDLLVVVLESLPGFSWLEQERGWFWLPSGRNRLLNQVEKIVSVAGSIELGELRAGVGRHHRMKGFRPPREVLAELCVQSGLYRRDGERIVGGPDLPDWSAVLGGIERTLVELLFDHGPVMRREDLERLAVGERGVNRSSFYVYLTYSPVLERYAPGVTGLRGASVSAAEVEALIPQRVRHQVLQDHGWTEDRQVWVAFRISPAAEATGVLGTPAALRNVAQGSYELHDDDGRPVGTLVVEQSMWGLSPFFRRWGVEAGDYVVLQLNLTERRALILAGDQELLVRYQQAE
jgi:hypothetical protein